MPSLILSALELSLPPVIEKIASFEEYRPETSDRITVGRFAYINNLNGLKHFEMIPYFLILA